MTFPEAVAAASSVIAFVLSVALGPGLATVQVNVVETVAPLSSVAVTSTV